MYIFTQGLQGLRNLGNTCYVNSIVQILFVLRPVAALIDNPPPQSQILSSLHALKEQLALKAKRRSVISPTEFVRTLWRELPQFGGYLQHDAHELLLALVDKVGPPLTDIFRLVSKNRITCRRCGHGAESQSREVAMLAPLKRPLALVGDEEPLLGYKCDSCGEESCFKTSEWLPEGQILTVAFSRFAWDGRALAKVKDEAAVREVVEVGGRRYELRGALLHQGARANIGHYVSCAFHDKSRRCAKGGSA